MRLVMVRAVSTWMSSCWHVAEIRGGVDQQYVRGRVLAVLDDETRSRG